MGGQTSPDWIFGLLILMAVTQPGPAEAEPISAVSPSDLVFDSSECAIVVIRHAEKADGPNPPLAGEGETRAENLGLLLSKLPVDTVYSTETRRTWQTATLTALAAEVDLEPTPYDAVGPLIEELRGCGGGRRILVVGHSDTVPEIVRELGGPPGLHIREDEFNHLFVVVQTADKVCVRHYLY